MKRAGAILGIVLLCSIEFAQELQHEAVTINVEVPVRVFKGTNFVNDLTLHDFELYEDGVLQHIEALYLIRETKVERGDLSKEAENKAAKFYSPRTKRNFVIMFEITEYLPRVGDAIDYFFNDVLLPDDTLAVVTPRKNYKFNAESFERWSKSEIAEQLKSRLKQDAVLSSREYKSLLRDFKSLKRTFFPPDLMDLKTQMLLEIFRNIKSLTYFNQKNACAFADYLKELEGQKHVFFFYQKNLIPIPPELDDYDKFELFPDIALNTNAVRDAFSGASITCHFLYIPDAPRDDEGFKQSEFGGWIDTSAEIFRGFTEMSDATGGLSISSINAEFSFKQAMTASENYYVLFYTPKDYKSDGKFRKIKVKIKGKNYKVLHRAGYLAD
jgi:hypothetical protein